MTEESKAMSVFKCHNPLGDYDIWLVSYDIVTCIKYLQACGITPDKIERIAYDVSVLT